MKKLVLLVCVACLAASVGVAGAYFGVQRSVADNVVTAGKVSVVTDPTVSALVMDDLAPGTADVRWMTVTNDGSLPTDVIVTNARRAGITAFYNVLECTVTNGDTEIYSGLLSQMQTDPVALAPGESANLGFEIVIPAEANNSFAGDHTRFTLYFDAQQQR